MSTAAICGWMGAAALLMSALALPATAQQDQDADAAEAPTGPRACLPRPTIDRTKILSGRSIVFVTRDDRIYHNELPKACPSLNRRSLVNYGIQNGRMCAGDRFQVLMDYGQGNYQPAAMCQLGTFVPITEAELDDLTAMTDANRTRTRRGRSKREALTTERIEAASPAAPAGGETAHPR